jgi:cysteine-rich repeat protein
MRPVRNFAVDSAPASEVRSPALSPMQVLRSAVVLLVVFLVADARLAGAWESLLEGTPPDARPFAVAADGAGNVVTAGRTPSGTGTSDGLVASFAAPDGARRWQRLVRGDGSGNNIVRALALDADGNALIAAQVRDADTNADALVAKLSASNGSDVWSRQIDGGRSGNDDARAVGLLANGDVIAAGVSATNADPDPAIVWRMNGGTGRTMWEVHLPGTGGSAQRVAVLQDDVYVAQHVPFDDGTRIFVARIDAANGDVLWHELVPGTGNTGDEVIGLAVRGTNHVIVAATLHGGGSAPDFVVSALDVQSGQQAWDTVLDGSASGGDDGDAARAVAVDGENHVVAAGVLSSVESGADFVVVRLRGSNGDELWRGVAEGSSGGSEDVRDLALDAEGDVVVAGRLRNVNRNGDLSVVKFAGATGDEIWQRSFDGAESGSDTAFNVAIDGAGHVAVAGRVRNGTRADGYLVARLAGASGGSLPCGDGNADAGEACDDGNPVAGDGCRTDCTVEVCGDGVVDPDEECDDGNDVDGDCCSGACGRGEDGGSCDDGNACTDIDRCEEGACVGRGEVDCPATGRCEVGQCSPVTGECVYEPLEDGERCDDGRQCTIADRCTGGVCIGGPPPFCDDDDPCTSDGCRDDGGCVFPPLLGFPGVLCVFERRAIAFECREPLPFVMADRLERAESMLRTAADQTSIKVAVRALKKARRLARGAQRLATRWRNGGLIEFRCGQAIVNEMSFLRARISKLRADLR